MDATCSNEMNTRHVKKTGQFAPKRGHGGGKSRGGKKRAKHSAPLSAYSAALRGKEKAPPGMEPVVRKLKTKKGIDNPYAVAWAMKNKNGESDRPSFTESVRISEALDGTPAAEGRAPEGPIVKVILLTEGLGNMRDKNYYGPEAVQSMPEMFEGKKCMVDHPSNFEEQDIPEGRVGKTVGYYKNLRVETVDTPDGPKLACCGELHFDLSESGREAFNKARTAVHYGKEFPGSRLEYVGLSVNAYGDSEPRTMTIEGESIEVNYVTRFTEVRSCDMVTIPARGGKFVALVESMAGAGGKNREVRTMIVTSIQEAVKALKTASGEKDNDLRLKGQNAALAILETLEADLAKKAKSKESEDGEDEDGEDEKKSKQAEGEDGEGEAESEAEDGEGEDGEDEDGEDEDGDDDNDADSSDDSKASHTKVTMVKKTGKAATMQSESARRAHRLAIKGLIKESGLTENHFDMQALAAMPFSKVERKVKEAKRMCEAERKLVFEKLGTDFTATHFAKIHESVGGVRKTNDDLFSGCTI